MSGYSSSSWESSFDSQCLEIIRSRGGCRVLPRQPPITGQRKIFPFITRIFLCSSSHGRPAEMRGVRDDAATRRTRGLAAGKRAVSGIDNDGGVESTTMAMRARRMLDSKVMGGGGDNVCSDTSEIHRYTDTDIQTWNIPRHLDCTLHPPTRSSSYTFAICRWRGNRR